MLKKEVKRKKKRESYRNSGSGKDQKEEMTEIEADRKKVRAKEKYEEETRISLYGGQKTENQEGREISRAMSDVFESSYCYVQLASSRWQHVELYGGLAAMRLDNAHQLTIFHLSAAG